jgi:hypothetical protein
MTTIEAILESTDFGALLSLYDHRKNEIIIKTINAIIKILDCDGDVSESITSPWQEEFGVAGGIVLTLGLFIERAAHNPLLKERAIALLRICLRNAENAICLVEQDALFLFLQLLQDGSQPDVQENAAGCLWNICLHKSLHDAVAQIGGLDVVITVLQQVMNRIRETQQPEARLILFLNNILYSITVGEPNYQQELCEIPIAISTLIQCLETIDEGKL